MSDIVKIGASGGEQGRLLACWECQTRIPVEQTPERHFCQECGKVQPLPSEADYFSFFALPRSLQLDPVELEKTFHQLSWKLHPDRFHNATGFERELSLDLTAVLNDAFRTLRDPVRRTEYLLRLEEVRKEGEVRQQAPPDLLEEVFELNEHLEELRAARRAGTDARQLEEMKHQLQQARAAFEQKMEEVMTELTGQFARWEQVRDGAGPDRSDVLRELNEILNRHNYIRNLVESVNEELGE